MGYSSPQVGYTGYAPTDDKLQEDTNTYTETNNWYVTKIIGYTLSDVQKKSKLRFKAEIRNNVNFKTSEITVLIGGEEIWYDFNTTNVWVQKTADKLVTWRRGDVIAVMLRCDSTGGQAELKNFEICGKISPMRLG